MANATSRLQIQIDAKNNASPALRQVAADAGALEGAFSKIGAGLAAGLTVAAVQQVAEMGLELARTAAEAERVGTAFEGLAQSAGQSSDAMLAAMKEASRGTISDTELMLSANRAMMLGVADSADEMATLLEVAGARGKAMGLSTAQAFNDLTTGLGRQSAMILDNLGITVDAEQANQAYADSLGRSASSLSDAERKQALLNAVIKDSTDIINANKDAGDDAASNFERMDASISNAKVALGELFSPAIVVVAQAIADAATQATEAMKEQAAAAEESNVRIERASDMAAAAAANQEAFGEATDAASGFLAPFVDWLRQGNEEYGRAVAASQGAAAGVEEVAVASNHATYEIRSLTSIMASANAMFAQLEVSSLNAGRAVQEAALMANLAQEAFANLRAEQAAIANEIDQAAASAGAFVAGKLGGDAGLSKQRAVTDELKSQVEVWKDQGYTQQQINDVLLPGMVTQINEAERAVFKTAGGTAKISDEAREAERAFSDLQSAVEGVLSGALDPGVGVDPDKLLEAMGFPREDAINENARRLADIAANGLKDQDWLGEFGAEVPDIWRMIRTAQNPQEEAARLLKDFQDGLLTAPIDKAKAKEIVRRQIMGDQNMAAFANEIATELAAEMGIPLQQALAATQGTLGGGSGSEAAATFAESAAAGLDEAGGGAAFVGKFTEQMKASYGLLSTAGRDAGKLWGASFLETVGDSVPASLISLLTDLVTPGVFAKFAQQGSLTGSAP